MTQYNLFQLQGILLTHHGTLKQELEHTSTIIMDLINKTSSTTSAKRSVDINHVFVRGSGIEKEGVYANTPSSFIIQACNFLGEELRSGGEQFVVKVRGREGIEVEALVHDQGDGSYEVEYLPLVPDEYSVEVTLNGQNIKGTPNN